ncbi:MAG TPA: thioesterase family protein [Aliidongia sp.]|nr:thioesterase family protein [Aliidongia sp.]
MSEIQRDVVLTDRSGFTFWHEDVLRFGDLDRQNHINNVAFASFYEGGRVRFFDSIVRPVIGWADLFALVKITIEYRQEMHFPGVVEVGTRLARLGRSSIAFEQALFNEDRCVSTAESVVVLMDATTRKSKPFPDEAAATLRGFINTAPI